MPQTRRLYSRRRKSRKLRSLKKNTKRGRAFRSRRPRRRMTGGFSCHQVLADRERNTLIDPNYYRKMTVPSKIKYQVCKHLLSRTKFREASMARKANLSKQSKDAKTNLTKIQKEQSELQHTLKSETNARDETITELKDALQMQKSAAKSENDSDKALIQTYVQSVASNASEHEKRVNELNDRLSHSKKDSIFYKMQFMREQVKKLPEDQREHEANMTVRTSAFAHTGNERANAVSTYLQTGTIPAKYKGNLDHFLDPDRT